VPLNHFKRLLDELDPLAQFNHMQHLENELCPHNVATTRALMAANDLQLGLGMTRRPQAHQAVSHHATGPADTPIVFDTGCSLSVTPFLDDFEGELEEPDTKDMKGLSDTVSVDGMGQVAWTVRDAFGNVGTVRTKAYYIPSATIRLFCPQQYFSEYECTAAHLYKSYVALDTHDAGTLTFPYSDGNQLPLMLLDRTSSRPDLQEDSVLGLLADINSVNQLLDDQNRNLTKDQKELLLWHQRLGHSGFHWNQTLMNARKVDVGDTAEPPTITPRCKGAARCDHPKCVACQLAKQHRRSPGSTSMHAKPEREMAIRRNNLKPGDCVSMDQYICKTPGRLAHTYGKEKPTERYHGGTIFVDHASGFIYTHNQVSLRAGETLQAKRSFERGLDSFGIKVKAFRADNHPFSAKVILDDLELQGQSITYSGVGAHFQNGVSERALLTVVSWARALMMHQLVHWPDQFDPALWPFAMDHAVFLWNHMPRPGQTHSPVELLTGTKLPGTSPLQRTRVWGCPAYVLDPKLQDGKKLPKWKQRSRQGVYLGISPDHSPTVGLILSPITGAITPQYHVIYDELYSTAFGMATDDVFDGDLWDSLLALGGLETNNDPIDLQGDTTPFQDMYDEFTGNSDSDQSSSDSDDDDSSDDESVDLDPISPEPPPLVGTPVPRGEDTIFASASQDQDNPNPASGETTRPRRPTRAPRSTPKPLPTGTRTRSRQVRTRAGRPVRPNPRFAGTYEAYVQRTARTQPSASHLTPSQVRQYQAGGNDRQKIRASELQAQYLMSLSWEPSVDSIRDPYSKTTFQKILSTYDPTRGTVEDWHPLALAAKANDPDTLDWFQAMNSPNKDGFWRAAEIEYETLQNMGTWDVVKREDWMKVIPGVWVFRQKRYPSGEIKKIKGRFCVRGDLQDLTGRATYSPTANWNTIRLMLMMTAQLGLASTQVDFVSAFCQADIDLPVDYDLMTPEEQSRVGVFVEMPRGFEQPGHVLKLKKSLYGLSTSPRNFYLHSKSKLEDAGLICQESVDPCLFMSDKVICVMCVDDCLFFAKDQADIDDVVARLSQEIDLERESDVAGFLGVELRKNPQAGTVTLTQDGLTKRIIEALDIDDLPPVDTPCGETLGKDEDGDPPCASFNYASVIGMLWYLYGHSRPDLGMSVSQLARFTFCPKRSHELALIRVGQYLKGTLGEGLILKPGSTDSLKMDAYVDSDFMGLYGKENRLDPTNCKSRTGFLISLNGCPIIWSSKLQDSIALSTMMAEYYALSSAMREVIPLRNLVKTVGSHFGFSDECVTEFHTKVWEDNVGALTLANLDPGQQTPRSKFYDVRVHWFRSHLSRYITVEKIDTKLQQADLWTKPLPRDLFQALRKLVMGW